jgi:hypothetical protein
MVFFDLARIVHVYSRVDGFIGLSFAAVFLVVLVLWKATPRLGTMLALLFMLLTLLPYGFLAVGDVLMSGRVHMTFWIPTIFSVMIMRAALSTQRYRRVLGKAHLAMSRTPNQAKQFQVAFRIDVLLWLFACLLSLALGAIIRFAAAMFVQNEKGAYVHTFGYFEGMVLGLAVDGIVWGLLVFGAPFFWNRARRAARLGVNALRAQDRRRPILYLRSFHDDDIKFGGRLRQVLGFVVPLIRVFTRDVGFEEDLVNAWSQYGPVVAISRPGEPLPPIGAAREHCVGDDWRALVVSLIDDSVAINVVLGDTPGLLWELSQLRDLGALQKLIVIVPPLQPDSLRIRLRTAQTAIPELSKIPDAMIVDKALALSFSKEALVVTIGGARRAGDYFEAVRHLAARALISTS